MKCTYIGLQVGINDAFPLVNVETDFGVNTVSYSPVHHLMSMTDKAKLFRDIYGDNVPAEIRGRLIERYGLIDTEYMPQLRQF